MIHRHLIAQHISNALSTLFNEDLDAYAWADIAADLREATLFADENAEQLFLKDKTDEPLPH